MQKKSLKDVIKDEYTKCAKDPIYFMSRFCKIQHPKKGKVLFNLYDFQETALQEIVDNRFTVILKSRQLGISTLTAGYALHSMIFNSDYNVLVIATTQDVAKNLVTKVRVMYENLPSWLRAPTDEHNKLGIRFKNGSQIKAVSSTSSAGRSEALSLLIIDEAAFVPNADEIWTSAQSTLSTGGSAIILSTPNGTGNFFHKIWVGTDAPEPNGFYPIILHWSVHPERDQSWRDEQTAKLGEKAAAQECDCDFITSGHTVVDGPILQWYRDNYEREPIQKLGQDGNYWKWKECDYTKDYMVIADVARGDGNDFSAFQVIDVEAVEQVAEYKGVIGTKDYGNFLVNVATEYNDALLVIENASVGWAAIQPAIDRQYRNLYYTYKSDGYVDPEVQLAKRYDLKDKSQMVPGFTTSGRTRPLIISKLETSMREKLPLIYSRRLIDELFVFIWKGQRPEAQQGYNDDLVLSFSIGLWVRDTALRLRQEGMELTRRSLGGISNSKGLYSSTNNKSKLSDSGWTHQIKGEDSDLTWLI